MRFHRLAGGAVFACCLSTLTGCAATAATAAQPNTPPTENVPEQIVSSSVAGSARELFARGDSAVLAGEFDAAKNHLETLVAAWRGGSTDSKAELEPLALYDLGLAYEGLGKRALARDVYLELERRFAEHTVVRGARSRLFSIFAYTEDWSALGGAAERALSRSDQTPADRMGALAARALARIERGEEPSAARDVQEGLDLFETLSVGAGGRLPSSAAMLKLAQAEVRRVQSERFVMVQEGRAVTTSTDLTDFMPKLEARCQGLMAAQRNYTDAMRAKDPFFIAFGAYRVGEMYKLLHKELMAIPPPVKAKTDEQRDIFFAMMHVRYRVLLEKAHDMMALTLSMTGPSYAPTSTASASAAVADEPIRDPDFAVWLSRAAEAKAKIEGALAEEKAYLAKLPYNEATVQRALEMLKERVEARTKAAASKGPPAPAPKPANGGS